ncbi:hypothetical protein WICPIJ_005282 [Wickerhamomyces pijperi]|uniref:Uncharacterized protein n=1 Tax=Wickerhamomyces pijperi TaxID=599730 RepID=A0A9P8TLA1_WICPI|nr:hypothetical protein WICPIJ_005282 [Wickerhamomyces pijperi]
MTTSGSQMTRRGNNRRVSGGQGWVKDVLFQLVISTVGNQDRLPVEEGHFRDTTVGFHVNVLQNMNTSLLVQIEEHQITSVEPDSQMSGPIGRSSLDSCELIWEASRSVDQLTRVNIEDQDVGSGGNSNLVQISGWMNQVNDLTIDFRDSNGISLETLPMTLNGEKILEVLAFLTIGSVTFLLLMVLSVISRVGGS